MLGGNIVCEDDDDMMNLRITSVEGWEGQPKGMLQILWERGFVDPNIPVETLYNA